MSHYLFSFDHLKHLLLSNCRLKLPVGFKGFARLITLDLNSVSLNEYTKLIFQCPMLEHLKLDGVYTSSSNFPPDSAVNLMEYFGQLSFIKQLEVDLSFLRFLSRGDIPQKLPNSLSHLSDIKCGGINFSVMAEVSCVLWLMRSSPNLLKIKLRCCSL